MSLLADKIIEEIVQTTLGAAPSARQKYLTRELLRSLVRVAQAECAGPTMSGDADEAVREQEIALTDEERTLVLALRGMSQMQRARYSKSIESLSNTEKDRQYATQPLLNDWEHSGIERRQVAVLLERFQLVKH